MEKLGEYIIILHRFHRQNVKGHFFSKKISWFIARWIASNRSLSVNGFWRQAITSGLLVLFRVCAWLKAVMNIIGILDPEEARCSCSSKPVIPGIFISRIRIPGLFFYPHRRKSSAEVYVSTSNPSNAISRFKALQIDLSSSTI